jgi:spoIIIJ-associated protein
MSEHHQTIQQFIEFFITCLGMTCTIANSRTGDGHVLFSVTVPEDARFLIGRNGQNLQALNHIIRLIGVNNQEKIIIDVNDYRQQRALEIEQLVRATVVSVRSQQKAQGLGAMSAYERRIVHTHLASYTDVTGESVGQEPTRSVVIRPLL